VSIEGYVPNYIRPRTTTPIGFVADVTFGALEKLASDPKISYVEGGSPMHPECPSYPVEE